MPHQVSKLKISIVMVDGSFRESFHAIEYFGKQSMNADDYELLWVEYYKDIEEELASEISQFDNFKIITLGYEPDDVYHSSYCFNRGIIEAQGELIVIPDADIVPEADFLDRIWHEHQENEKLVMYLYRYDQLEAHYVPNWDLKHLRQTTTLRNPSNYGGCLTVRKKWLLEINGYEQHPIFGTGFHANGLHVYTRLKSLGLHVMWHPNVKLYHPWHPFTLVGAPQYKYQNLIINYQERLLDHVAFQGIDSARNRDLPPDLVTEIKALEEKLSKKGNGSGIKNFIKRLLG